MSDLPVRIEKIPPSSIKGSAIERGNRKLRLGMVGESTPSLGQEECCMLNATLMFTSGLVRSAAQLGETMNADFFQIAKSRELPSHCAP
jgi:hypothetical protein